MFSEHIIPIADGQIQAVFWEPEKAAAKGIIPLVYINGGPGGTYLGPQEILAPVLSLDRPVILYDQLGSYHSPAPFGSYDLSMERYVGELLSLLDYFQMDQAILLGHSFGGSIAADFSLAYPSRVSRLILSSPLLSTPRWIEDANLLLQALPERERDALQKHLAGEEVDQAAYDQAERVFYGRHLCRLDPWPSLLLQSFSRGNPALYQAMWGRSEFVCTGTLKDYDRFSDLRKLAMPVLLTCGYHDEARPETMNAAADLIRNAGVHVFSKSSHTPLYEQTEEYLSVVQKFCGGSFPFGNLIA